MAMWPNPCVRVCVSVSRVPAGRMEMESLPATRRVGVAAPLSVFRPAAWIPLFFFFSFADGCKTASSKKSENTQQSWFGKPEHGACS